MQTDLTFFTNEPGYTLLDRFKKILKHIQFFDVLVGYFRTSGFFNLYESLEDVEKIRILVGLNIDQKTYVIIESSKYQQELDFESHKRTKDIFSKNLITEMDNSADDYETEVGVKKFIEFLQSGKLEIKAYPSSNIHAKVYISRFPEDSLDYGRVITGSSNFSESGFVENREFNVELKNSSDVRYALEKFEDLWKDAVDISRDYVETINTRTWLNDQITPYHLYLKFLYEYFQEDINLDEDFDTYLPEGFMELEYQKQSVVSAKKILDAYNGVFLADVVGLGKTFISALLAQQCRGKILVLCPPALKDYWYDTFSDFGIRSYRVESIGKLDIIIKRGIDRYEYIFIDEAHRFRNEATHGYEKLHQICFGKKVILVSATPLNNTIDDIYSQLKLFQIPKKCTIPGVPNLEKLFRLLKKKLEQYKKTDPDYIDAVKAVSREMREKILGHVMVRRTRTEVLKHFKDDIDKQGLHFPEVDDPQRVVYTFDEKTNNVFNATIELLKKFKYARYTPLLYLKKPVSEFERQSQRNVGGFMKGILVKRLESSFYAFTNTLRRFIESYEKFIDMYKRGTVYISKEINVYEFLDSDNEDVLLKMVDRERVHKYDFSDFTYDYVEKLEHDLRLLTEIRSLWIDITSDPKLGQFIKELENNRVLKNRKIIIFTESKETGDHLYNNLNGYYPGKVMFYSGQGGRYEGVKQSSHLARETLTAYMRELPGRTPYDFKRHAIQESIYGVDIDSSAVDIAKLRLWLSLVVDEEDFESIKPLPNLDYKIVCGNSLLGVQRGLLNAHLYKELEFLKQKYFDETNPRKKKEEKGKIDELIKEITNNDEHFDFEVYFSEVCQRMGGFDVVIANPPYVRHEAIKNIKKELKKGFGEFYCGTADIYTYFYKKGLDILKTGGHLCFIAPNKFMRAGYGKNTRNLLAGDATPRTIIDFGDLPIFDATTYPAILLLEKRKPGIKDKTTAASFSGTEQLDNLEGTLENIGFAMPVSALRPEGWSLERPKVLALMEKLRSAGTPLGEYVKGRFYRGVLTGLNNKAFVIDAQTRESLIAEDPSSEEIITPWLRGRDIVKWKVEWAGLYIIFTRRGIEIESYPAIKRHLEQYREELEPKKTTKEKFGRKPGSYKWYEIQDNIAYYKEFEQPKIIYPNITKTNIFAFDSSGIMANQKCFIIPVDDLYLLALLNSKLTASWFTSTLPRLRGGFFEPSSIFMQKLPIFPASEAQRTPILKRVQNILESPDSSDVSRLESEIDELIYELYDLTPGEVEIVKRN